MDPQLVTLIGNSGALGVVLVIYIWHILPAQKEEQKLTRESIKEAAATTAAATKEAAAATGAATDRNTIALERNTTVTAGVGERLTYLEGALGVERRAPSGPIPIAGGGRDSEPINVRRTGR